MSATAMKPVDVEKRPRRDAGVVIAEVLPGAAFERGLDRVFGRLNRTGPDNFPCRLGLECHRLFSEWVRALAGRTRTGGPAGCSRRNAASETKEIAVSEEATPMPLCFD